MLFRIETIKIWDDGLTSYEMWKEYFVFGIRVYRTKKEKEVNY